MYCYSSTIRDDKTTDSHEVDIYFYLTRKVDCKDIKRRDIYLEKLKRLQSEDFNRVKVPPFYYEYEDNIVTCVSRYVKGLYAMTNLEQRQIIYEDVVEHKSDWTFSDFGVSNFIVEEDTNIIFSVDLQSYKYHPNLDKRITAWNTQSNDIPILHL